MTNLSKTVPQLRVEKTTKNRDDLRVMMAGAIFLVLLIGAQTLYARVYDAFFADRPFISATVEIIHVAEDLPPLIKYDADPNQDVSGVWIASIYSSDDIRLGSRRGTGNYIVRDDEPKLWAWSAWFDNEESDPPAVPDEPFYVCVRYVITANDSGVEDSTDPYCSNVYDQKDPLNTIIDYVAEDVIK